MPQHRIAWFISPHGFGHAARASAVMAALRQMDSSLRFELFTTVPPWFFEQSVPGLLSFHPVLTDVGFVQKTSLNVDLPNTRKALDAFLPLDPRGIEKLAREIGLRRCELVVCDIAPLGIAVAREARVPSVLVENFTWDWIYEGYLVAEPALKKHMRYFTELFELADYFIQVQPLCSARNADLTTGPISRAVRTPPGDIRSVLHIPDNAEVVMVTMGGIPEAFGFLKALEKQDAVYFIIPGGSPSMEIRDNLVLLPRHSPFHHPDLINASDAVIGKIGYSTLAEVYHAGVPFGYIARPDFRESPVLARYIETHMKGIAIQEDDFKSGKWISRIHTLLTLPKIRRRGPNGAEQASDFIWTLLESLK